MDAPVVDGSMGPERLRPAYSGNQKALKRPDLERYAREIGLDVGKLATALDSRRHRARVEADVDIADRAGIRGTPAFVINGYFLSGAQPQAKFDKLIRRALAEAP